MDEKLIEKHLHIMDDKLHIDWKFDKKFPYYGWKVSTS